MCTHITYSNESYRSKEGAWSGFRKELYSLSSCDKWKLLKQNVPWIRLHSPYNYFFFVHLFTKFVLWLPWRRGNATECLINTNISKVCAVSDDQESKPLGMPHPSTSQAPCCMKADFQAKYKSHSFKAEFQGNIGSLVPDLEQPHIKRVIHPREFSVNAYVVKTWWGIRALEQKFSFCSVIKWSVL